jgi:hypothetical protein
MTSSGRRFLGLARYLLHGRSGEETERVAWTTGRNLGTDDPKLAAALMQVTADQNVRVEAPVYHLTISFDPSDTVTRERMEAVADRVLADLGLSEHQALLVAHQDRAHPHVHLMVNRVHPETGLAWERWQDRPRIERSLRELEQALGLRAVAGRLYQLEGQELPERALLTTGEYQQALRTGEPAFPDRVRAHLPELRAAHSWAELEERLNAHGLRLERKGQGLIITDGEHQVKASRVARDLSLRRLEDRFGMRFPGREPERDRQEPLSRNVAQLPDALKEYERVAAIHKAQEEARKALEAIWPLKWDLDREMKYLQEREELFNRLLAAVYCDPAAARVRLQEAKASLGPEHAVDRLRTEPERFGALRTVEQPRAWGLLITHDDTLARENARHAAKQWQDLQGSEHAALSHARKYQVVDRDTTALSAVERALAHVGELIAQAQETARRLTEDMQQAPSLGLLTHSIGRLVARLEPREITQVRMLLTAPQAALAFAAREAVKDIVLGREDYY